MNTIGRIVPLAIIPAAAFLAGCGTPKPARELAAQGALVSAQADAEIRAAIERATDSYKRREAIVLRLAKGEIADLGNNEFNAWLEQEVGLASSRDKSQLIKAVVERSRVARESIQTGIDKKSKELLSAFGEPVTAPVKNLAEAKKAFLVLAQELTPQEWLEFTRQYAKQLQADIKAIESQPGKGDSSD